MRIKVLSLNPNVTSLEELTKTVTNLVEQKKGGYICFSTVHMTMEAEDDPDFRKQVNSADYIVTDGMPMVWMQKLQGAKSASRLRANDAMIALLKHAEKNGFSVGFYGSSETVIEAIKQRVKRDFPDLKVSYAYSPPFRTLTEKEDEEIVKQINNASPDILFVGLGCPKQEKWMASHKSKIKSVMLGVGASFDFFAGKVPECPEWLGRLGLEWLFRLFQEPRRLWRRYIILNPRFVFLALMQLIGLKK